MCCWDWISKATQGRSLFIHPELRKFIATKSVKALDETAAGVKGNVKLRRRSDVERLTPCADAQS